MTHDPLLKFTLGSDMQPRRVTQRDAILFALCLIATVSLVHAADEQAGGFGAAVPAAPPVTPISKTGQQLLKDVFEASAVSGPRQPAVVQKLLTQLKREIENDSRLDYVVGVAQLRQGQFKQAAVSFESSIRRSTDNDWPAWQAMIWGHLAERNHAAGLARLDEFAQLIGSVSADEGASPEQREAAEWVGEVMEGLDQTIEAKQKKDRELLDQQAERFEALLSDELFEAYEGGREKIRERARALDWKLDVARSKKGEQEEQSRRKRSDRIADRLKEAEGARDENERSADEWKKWLDKTLPEIERQLGKLEKDYGLLEQRARSLLESNVAINSQLNMVQQMPNPGGAQGIGAEAQRAQAMMQLQYKQYVNQVDYNMTLAKLSQTAQQGLSVQKLRAQTLQRYQKATGEIANSDEKLNDWESRLTTQQKKLATQPAKLTAKKPAKPLPRSFKTLVEFDFDAEQKRIYKQYGLAAAPPAADNDPFTR